MFEPNNGPYFDNKLSFTLIDKRDYVFAFNPDIDSEITIYNCNSLEEAVDKLKRFLGDIKNNLIDPNALVAP